VNDSNKVKWVANVERELNKHLTVCHVGGGKSKPVCLDFPLNDFKWIKSYDGKDKKQRTIEYHDMFLSVETFFGVIYSFIENEQQKELFKGSYNYQMAHEELEK
jgi:hypothetical protein